MRVSRASELLLGPLDMTFFHAQDLTDQCRKIGRYLYLCGWIPNLTLTASKWFCVRKEVNCLIGIHSGRRNMGHYHITGIIQTLISTGIVIVSHPISSINPISNTQQNPKHINPEASAWGFGNLRPSSHDLQAKKKKKKEKQEIRPHSVHWFTSPQIHFE